jgi:hypothetical protein
MKQKFIIITCILTIIVSGYYTEAQDFKITRGIVTAFNGIPLNNVTISALKSEDKAYTDSTGQFAIMTYNKDVLTISASGFAEEKIRIKKDKLYKINLVYQAKANSYNDAINNRHITESALKQAINPASSSKGKDYSKYENIYDLISSEIYNVRVKGTSVVNTRIRSFDSSPQVLYVVDDRIVSDISYILTDDVKSIEFIDDVGTTIYGMQGANGVLKITLK